MNALVKSATIVDPKSDFHNETVDILMKKVLFPTSLNAFLIRKTTKKLNATTFISLKVGLIVA